MPLVELELFKSGDYPQGKFTDEDVQEIVDSYDPEKIHRAPLVVGHKTNAERAKTGEPAYGYFDSLKRIGAKLFGQCNAVDAAENLMSTTHRTWSVELYPKGKLQEAGGKLYLKAVALLGAAAPQIKGLASAKFNDAFGDSIVIPQEGDMPENVATKDDLEKSESRLMTFIKDNVISIFSKKEVKKKGKKFSDDDDDSDDSTTKITNEVLDDMTKPEIGEMLEVIGDNERVQEVAAELEKEVEETRMAEQDKDPNIKFRKDTEKKAIADWVDSMIKIKKLSPKAKDAGVVAFCQLLADSNEQNESMKFNEKGDAVTPLAFLQKLVEEHITAPGGESAPNTGDGNKKKSNLVSINFKDKNEAGQKIEMAEDSISLAEESTAYAKEHKIDLAEAMSIVGKQREVAAESN